MGAAPRTGSSRRVREPHVFEWIGTSTPPAEGEQVDAGKPRCCDKGPSQGTARTEDPQHAGEDQHERQRHDRSHIALPCPAIHGGHQQAADASADEQRRGMALHVQVAQIRRSDRRS